MFIDINTPAEMHGYAEIDGNGITYPVFTCMYHFFECEKYRDVNEEYRKFLLNIDDPTMIDLESRHIGWKDILPKWHDKRNDVALSMAWFFLFQHYGVLKEINKEEEIEISDQLSELFKKLISLIQTEEYSSLGIIVSPDFIPPENLNNSLDSIIPGDDFDFLVYGNDERTIRTLEPYASSRHFPVKRLEAVDYLESAEVLAPVLSNVLILTSELELKSAQNLAIQFEQQGVEVCLRVL